MRHNILEVRFSLLLVSLLFFSVHIKNEAGLPDAPSVLSIVKEGITQYGMDVFPVRINELIKINFRLILP
jgi:hypothetical protein